MTKGSGDDPGRLVPPHEARGPLGTIGDAGGGHRPLVPPGPALATTSSPGLSAAGALPPVGALLPADDPSALTLLIAKLAGEMFTGASVIPMPVPASVLTGAGLSAPASPGIAPQLVPSSPGFGAPTPDSAPAVASALAPSSPHDAMGPLGALPLASAAGPSAGASPSFGGAGGGAAAPLSAPFDPFTIAPTIPGATAPTGWLVPSGVDPSPAYGHAGYPPSAASHVSSHRDDTHPDPADPDRSRSQRILTGHDAASSHGMPTHDTRTTGMPAAHAHRDVSSRTHSSDRIPTSHDAVAPRSGSHAHDARGTHPAATAPAPNAIAPHTSAASVSALPAHELPAPPAAPNGGFGGPGDPSSEAATGAVPQVTADPSSLAAGGSPHAHVPHVPTGTAPSNPVLAPGVPSGMAPSNTLASGHPSFDPTGGLPGLSVPSSLAGLGMPADAVSASGSSPFTAPRFGAGQPDHLLAFPEAFRLPVVDADATTPIDAAPSYLPSAPAAIEAPARFDQTSLDTSTGSIVRDLGHTQFDPYRVRRDFPILDERVHGKRLVWLDNAATTQKPRAVIERLSHFYAHENSNVHRAAHTLAARATDAYESARETTRRFLNAPSSNEIVFVRGATEGINLIAQSWGRRNVKAGDEIVLTWLEHHANIVPWQQLCAETGARLRIAPVDDRGDVILEEYEKLFGPRTRLAAFTQVSNALGTITPAREMIEIAHRHGARVMLDGAQAVSHMRVDVQQLDCDFYVFSGHKVFAPTGIGAVYGKRDVLAAMPPWQGGGNMIQDVRFERTTYQDPPWRFEAGTGNIADAAGLGAALDYLMRIGMDQIDRYEHELLGYATRRLQTVPGLTIIGTAPHKAGVLSFVLDGQRTEDVGAALDKEGIAVRSGHHCAQPILRRFGLEASVRASLALYNICEDIDALIEALHRLQGHRV